MVNNYQYHSVWKFKEEENQQKNILRRNVRECDELSFILSKFIELAGKIQLAICVNLKNKKQEKNPVNLLFFKQKCSSCN